MRPCPGVVISTSAELLVRLESGAVVSVPPRSDLLRGDVCFVLFNYTTLEVYITWSEEQYHNLEDVFGLEPEDEEQPEFEEPWRGALLSDPVSGVSL
jgi:hypothetical protein